MKALQVIETSAMLRIGLKGPQAATWLSQQDLPLPAPWHWLEHQGLLILRLGESEFVLEAETGHSRLPVLCAHLQQTIAGVYPVTRYDASWLVSGESLCTRMAELCMVDWQHETHDQGVCMTQLAGIHATLIQMTIDDTAHVRVSCDASYRDYVHQVFSQQLVLS